MEIKTLADFKRALKNPGAKLHAIHHMKLNGYDENQKPIYVDNDMGIREVSKVQSNSFALKTTRTTGEVVDSWCSYPTAKFSKIENNKLIILERDGRLFTGGLVGEKNPEYAKLPLIPVLTYTFVD